MVTAIFRWQYTLLFETLQVPRWCITEGQMLVFIIKM